MSNRMVRASRALLAVSMVLLSTDRAEAQRPATTGAARPPAFRAIFEPVPYPADVSLNDVFFVTPEVGWATGGNGLTNGVIIGTRDGGTTWTVQIGDPESSERPYSQLRFVDGQIGFAAQSAAGDGHRLLRTTDGENWTAVGKVPEHRTDYAFVSATVGVTAISGKVLRTQDAGRTWREVLDCHLRVLVEGLTRDVRCDMHAFHFPTRRVGYALGASYGAPGVFVARTEDAGETWTLWHTMPEESGKESHVFFTDTLHGSACLIGGRLVATEDGGKTWSPVPGPECQGKPEVRFADPEVGWSAVYSALNFTVDGGRRWSGRQIRFPAFINAFSLPRRDRGYVVGDHGMVYRYRIVPGNQPPAPNELAAPLMPGISTALDERVTELDETIAALGEAVAAAPDSLQGAAPTAALPADPTLDAAPPDPNAEYIPIPPSDLPEASPFMVACCEKPQNRTKVLFSAIIAALPQMLERYRSTNTLGGTLLMLVELPLKAKGLRAALAAFRRAPDKASAQQALADLTAAAGELKTTTAMALQRTPPHMAGFTGPAGFTEPALTVTSDSSGAAAGMPKPAAGPGAAESVKGLQALVKKKVRPPR